MNLLSIYCILSWRIFWLTMLNRVVPDVPPRLALTDLEMDLLDELVRDKGQVLLRSKTLAYYLTKIARMGGYLARTGRHPQHPHAWSSPRSRSACLISWSRTRRRHRRRHFPTI